MKAFKDGNSNRSTIDRYAMALAYQEMGNINLIISKEMQHLEIEAAKSVETFLKNMNFYKC
ncbi:hypothetical protein [Lysinibacillus parviboronicapiens]|uniref:Uncharacterized protein n=1 Tax=Lysinibacillus parviboronicapiens TaxID=436516 RepID=A0ABV2PJT5_9BACI|nr:hypothetical protein [Lysinibacillus parviboronicapiens]